MGPREYLFLFGCMGTRLLITWLAYTQKNLLGPAVALVAAMISFGFMYIYLTGSRKTGPETFGEQIWWNDLRPIHSVNYGIFAYMSYTKNPEAWKILLLDVIIGFTAWVLKKSNNLRSLYVPVVQPSVVPSQSLSNMSCGNS